MIKERAWPVRAMYMLIAAALAMSLIIMAAPAQKVSAQDEIPDAEWERVSTPTTDGWVLAPNCTILDFAVADGGDVAYACVCSTPDIWTEEYLLLKSTDGAATWKDITSGLKDLMDVDGGDYIRGMMSVATDGVDPDFVAVALRWIDFSTTLQGLGVFFSTDGGATFTDASKGGWIEDGGASIYWYVNLAVSPEVDGERDMAVIGCDNFFQGVIFRSTVVGDRSSAWEDARYDGWNDEGEPSAFNSIYVTDVKFAPSWAADKTILVLTVAHSATGPGLHDVHLQSGTWGTTEGWNAQSVVAIDAVPIVEGINAQMGYKRFTGGITLPLDYSGRNSANRYAWVWVNYYHTTTIPYEYCGEIFRVKNDDADPVGPMGQIEDGEMWLTNVDYLGYISEGKAIAGVMGTGYQSNGRKTECCEGVQVYRNDGIFNMDICCEPWEEACKPPTGVLFMEAIYVSEDKAYAVDLDGDDDCYGEGACSVSFDDGDTWNQISLIDTNIDYLSDVAVSPDCNKTFLVSVNNYSTRWCCDCDSVWLYGEDLTEYGYSEYSGHWIRTWCGNFTGDQPGYYGGGLLRLNPEEDTGDTVYLVDSGTSTVYWSELEGLDCWNRGAASVDHIVDLAVLDKETIYALDDNGKVAMSDDYALGWHTAVESEVDRGWTIAVWGDHIIVGGLDGEVSYSDDGGETFALLEEIPTIDGYVTMAFDSYFDTNNVIYAATDEDDYTGGIYQWVIGESEKWMDLKAEPLESQIGIDDGDEEDETIEVAYTGLVVDRPGNPYTSSENGGVIYASYCGEAYDDDLGDDVRFTGAARSLERDITICTTCLVWDFLIEGLTIDQEGFEAWPDALKICGCLTPDTNSKLFAIDEWSHYDMIDGIDGALWTFEDCYAKKAPEITSPADGDVIAADPCSCYSVPFTVLWDSMCDACSYDIAFALDDEFEMPVGVNDGEGITYHVIGDVPSFSVMGGEAGGLSCETTYYVRVRAADAATGQIIHSFWSDPIEITIAPSVEAGIITLVAPEPGTTGVAINNIGFSWYLMATADAFDWVLSANADLSSPIATAEGLTTTSGEYSGADLDYETPYYWQVTAYNEGVPISQSSIGTFTTAAQAQFCCPQCGLCFDTQEELQEHIEDWHAPVTPMWVWVVIAIGAVLVIVVIVLIFRTRRV